MTPSMCPVVYRGRLVAIAGRTRCHVISTALSEAELREVLLMCLFLGAALRAGRTVPDLNRKAAEWAARAVERERLNRPR